MGHYNKGILGGFSGKVGTVVGVRWRGRNIMRSLPTRGSYTPTAEQETQREKFTVVARFLQPIRNIVGKYYGLKQGDKSRYNLATSYYLREALVLVGLQWTIDYAKAQISKGDLLGLEAPTLTPFPDQAVDMAWVDNSGQGFALPTDQLIVVAYSPDMDLFAEFENVATRSEELVALAIPSGFSGLEMEFWGTFISEDQKLAATSTYLGSVLIT